MGKSVKWDSQDRTESSTTFREAFRRHWWATALGIVWGTLLWLTVSKLFWWFAPVIVGFVLAIPFSVWSSRTSFGEWAKKRGLFLIRAERTPPRILKDFHHELDRAPHRPWSAERDGLAEVLDNANVRRVHLSLLPLHPPRDPMHEHHLRGLELKLQHAGVNALTPSEKRELLLSADSIRRLRPDPSFEEKPPADMRHPAYSAI